MSSRPGILLVSEDANLLSLVPAIESGGVAVRTVRNVFEAVVAFSREPASAVLLDLRDLDRRALEIVPALKRIAPAVRVVLLFTPHEREALAHGIALGASGALPKPFYVSEALALAAPPDGAAPTPAAPPPAASPAPAGAPPRREERPPAEIEPAAPAAPAAPPRPVGEAPSGEPLESEPLELLAGGVAHEINNPLSIISGWLQILKSEAPADDPRAKTYATVLEEVERIATIVRDLLRFSLREEPRLAPLDPAPLLIDAAASVAEDPTLSHLLVHNEAEPRLPEIAGDREQLRDVFLELVRNAAFATRGRVGHLTVRARRDGADRVEISFEDDGPGVPRANLPRVVEPFFSTFAGPGRRGLGLSMAHGVLRAHGGSLRVEAEDGRGCRVVLTLPVASRPAEPAAPPAGPSRPEPAVARTPGP